MATWSGWERPWNVSEWLDGNPAWADENNLELGSSEANHAPVTTLNGYSNRLYFWGWANTFASEGLTINHRLRAVEMSWEGRQGTLIGQVDPNDHQVYYTNTLYVRTPPITFGVWPGAEFYITPALGNWGLPTANDGVNAMRDLLDNTFKPRLRAKKARDVGSMNSYVRNVFFRIQYDDPVPAQGGILVGIA